MLGRVAMTIQIYQDPDANLLPSESGVVVRLSRKASHSGLDICLSPSSSMSVNIVSYTCLDFTKCWISLMNRLNSYSLFN